jgi:hypothetical protein
MTIVLTAFYGSDTAIENVVEDLVATGIDRDKILDDESQKMVKVMAPTSSEAEIREILGRHQPRELKESTITD